MPMAAGRSSRSPMSSSTRTGSGSCRPSASPPMSAPSPERTGEPRPSGDRRHALGGGGAQHVAAQFAFNGRSYLAIDQGVNTLFTDTLDSCSTSPA